MYFHSTCLWWWVFHRERFKKTSIVFLSFCHSDNQQLLLNSYASCRRLLDHTKHIVGLHQDGKENKFLSRNCLIFFSFIGDSQLDTIDLMDNEGKIKELSTHFDDYATQFLTARSTYYVLKVEGKYFGFLHKNLLNTLSHLVDNVTGDKRYTPNFNIDQIDQRLSSILTSNFFAFYH